MKVLTNKYFILGNLLLLLISIPVTLFFISRQQELRGRAAPTSTLSFSPENPNTSTQCQSFDVDLMIDPSSNAVSIVDFYLKYDPTKLDVLQIKESDKFPTVVRPLSISSGEANMSVSIGSDVTRAVQTLSKVATVTFSPKAAGSTQIQFDQERSRVFSLAGTDEPTENVLNQAIPANVTIGTEACPVTSTSPTPTQPISPSPTGSGATQPTPTPTNILLSPTPTGSPSGQLTPTPTLSVIATPTPTLSVIATPTPTVSPTGQPTPTRTPTPTSAPTTIVPSPGGVFETVGIIGTIILAIVGGLVLLTL